MNMLGLTLQRFWLSLANVSQRLQHCSGLVSSNFEYSYTLPHLQVSNWLIFTVQSFNITIAVYIPFSLVLRSEVPKPRPAGHLWFAGSHKVACGGPRGLLNI